MKKRLKKSTGEILCIGLLSVFCFSSISCKKLRNSREGIIDFRDTTLFGQTITPNKIWHIESGYPCPDGVCFYGLQTIKVGNKRTFNGKEYYELLSESNHQWNVKTYVREEDKKVFSYVEDNDEEHLMYDYNLNIGDEFTIKAHPELTDKFKVTEIDSIEYNGIKRKRLRLENLITIYQYDYWVEGIGCMRGIGYFASAHIGGAVHQLKNCYESDELIFVNENPEFCWVTKK